MPWQPWHNLLEESNLGEVKTNLLKSKNAETNLKLQNFKELEVKDYWESLSLIEKGSILTIDNPYVIQKLSNYLNQCNIVQKTFDNKNLFTSIEDSQRKVAFRFIDAEKFPPLFKDSFPNEVLKALVTILRNSPKKFSSSTAEEEFSQEIINELYSKAGVDFSLLKGKNALITIKFNEVDNFFRNLGSKLTGFCNGEKVLLPKENYQEFFEKLEKQLLEYPDTKTKSHFDFFNLFIVLLCKIMENNILHSYIAHKKSQDINKKQSRSSSISKTNDETLDIFSEKLSPMPEFIQWPSPDFIHLSLNDHSGKNSFLDRVLIGNTTITFTKCPTEVQSESNEVSTDDDECLSENDFTEKTKKRSSTTCSSKTSSAKKKKLINTTCCWGVPNVPVEFENGVQDSEDSLIEEIFNSSKQFQKNYPIHHHSPPLNEMIGKTNIFPALFMPPMIMAKNPVKGIQSAATTIPCSVGVKSNSSHINYLNNINPSNFSIKNGTKQNIVTIPQPQSQHSVIPPKNMLPPAPTQFKRASDPAKQSSCTQPNNFLDLLNPVKFKQTPLVFNK